MGLKLTTHVLHLPLRDPFVIAREEHTDGRAVTTVLVELGDPRTGATGLGEGYPDSYYGETPATMAAVMPPLLELVDERVLSGDLGETRAGLIATADSFDAVIRGHGAAKCALDIALHDLAAARLGLAVVELLGLSTDIPPTDFTLGIDAPDVVAERARRAVDFPALKIKVGGPADLATLEAVRGVYDGPIRVDANTSWTPAEADGLLPDLARLGVVLIEQPFPARRLDQLRWLQERSPIPIVADESAVAIEDLEGLVGVVAGVNVKLAKCGGVGPAKRMLEAARALGFRTFLGCMEETSVGIAASAAVASLAEWVDLDGCLLLAEDPFEGLELDADRRWRIGGRPGLGVVQRTGALPSTGQDEPIGQGTVPRADPSRSANGGFDMTEQEPRPVKDEDAEEDLDVQGHDFMTEEVARRRVREAEQSAARKGASDERPRNRSLIDRITRR